MKKQHILDEIKRTAVSNNGVPLGIRTFTKETGIKDTDWLGKYWARWSDAVKEAGLTPNEKQGAFEVDDIIEKVISVAREYGRLPFRTELKMKGYGDKTFPSLVTIYRRLGNSKIERAEKVREYCVGRTGYEDVTAMCDAIPKETASEESDSKEELEIGYVYLGKSGKHYKIGRSVAPGQRERQLAIQLPEKFVELHRIMTDDPVGIEAYWHKRFDAKRTNGEFFVLNSADVGAFKRRKFM